MSGCLSGQFSLEDGGGTSAPTVVPVDNSFHAQATRIPNVLYQLDAAEPASQSVLDTHKAGILLDSSSNVLAINESQNLVHITRGYGALSYVPTGGPNNLPYFHGDSASINTAYDGFVLPSSQALPIFTGRNASWSVIYVMKQTGGFATQLFVAQGDATLRVSGNASDGALVVDQNNISLNASEPSNASTALNHWQVVSLICDGNTIKVFRNGLKTAETPPGAIGQIGGIFKFELLNNPQADVAFIELAAGAPSIAQHNSEVQRLALKYGLSVSTVVEGSSTAVAPAAPDSYGDFLSTPIVPLTDIVPVDLASLGPGDGLMLSAGSPVMNMYFPGGSQVANVPDEATLRKYVYMNYMLGDLNQAFGSPVDTAQPNNSTFHAVARHYPLGSAHSTTPVLSDGLHIKAFCSANGTNCGNGRVFGGLVRLPPAIRPGMTVKVRYRSPPGVNSWVPIWLFSGEQRTPGPGGNPYSSGLLDLPPSQHNFEIDINDNFTRTDDGGAAVGTALTFGIPDIYSNVWPSGNVPHRTYTANDGVNFIGHPSAGPAFLALPNSNWTSTFHNLVLNWRNDGTGFLDVLVDGQVVSQYYLNYDGVRSLNSAGQPLGLSLMIGNQAIPSFEPTSSSAVDNDGIHTPGAEGWTAVVQEISIWNGNIVGADAKRATP